MIRRTEYVLRNKATGRLFEDTGWLLEDPLYGSDALIQAVYKNKQPDFSNHKTDCTALPIGFLFTGCWKDLRRR